ncbi:MAG: hypothetical protein QXS02_04790 [Candidatus Thermoplasmatota archaeon]
MELTEKDLPAIYEELIGFVKSVLVLPSYPDSGLDDVFYHIYALWVLSTWKRDVWNTVPFLYFIGLPGSGKSHSLQVLSFLCYRGCFLNHITPAGIPRLSHYYQPTMLVDEADSLLGGRKRGGEVFSFLKGSYKRGGKYIFCDLDDPKGLISINNYCFKAFACERDTIDTSLRQRGIVFYMFRNIPCIRELNDVKDEIKRLQAIFLNYRYKIIDPPEIPEDFPLSGRTFEIFEPLIRTALLFKPEIVPKLIRFAKEREKEETERERSSFYFEIISALHSIVNSYNKIGEDGEITYSLLLNEMGLDAQDIQNKKRLGRYLKELGFRVNIGGHGRDRYRYIDYNDKKTRLLIYNLFKRFNLETPNERLPC